MPRALGGHAVDRGLRPLGRLLGLVAEALPDLLELLAQDLAVLDDVGRHVLDVFFDLGVGFRRRRGHAGERQVAAGEVGEEGVDGEAEALEIIEDRIERAGRNGRHVLEGCDQDGDAGDDHSDGVGDRVQDLRHVAAALHAVDERLHEVAQDSDRALDRVGQRQERLLAEAFDRHAEIDQRVLGVDQFLGRELVEGDARRVRRRRRLVEAFAALVEQRQKLDEIAPERLQRRRLGRAVAELRDRVGEDVQLLRQRQADQLLGGEAERLQAFGDLAGAGLRLG